MAGGKKQTIGYQHLLGVHFVPCLGPVDHLTSVSVAERTLVTGELMEETINVNEPDLFGGQDREGGVTGPLSIYNGASDQGTIPYLGRMLGDDIPAFRGVVSVVLEQMYIGNNPYLKPWSFNVQRIFTTDPGYSGGNQWYPEVAGIPRITIDNHTSVYIAIDKSVGMAAINDHARGDYTASVNVSSFVDYMESFVAGQNNCDVRMVSFNETLNIFDTWRNVTSFSCYQMRLYSAIGSYNPLKDTDYDVGFSGMADFFDGSPEGSAKVAILYTTGDSTTVLSTSGAEAMIAAYPGMEVYVVNCANEANFSGDVGALGQNPNDNEVILLPLYIPGDPKPDNLVPVNFLGNQGIQDMNPAHILREVLLSPDTGGSGDEDEVGTTFAACALVLYEERFGLSMLWNTPSNRADFIKEIEQHIDGRVYQDRRTGLWEMKLIRDDYDPETLYVFDQSNVLSWDNLARPHPSTLPNQIVVTFTDPAKEEPGSVTLTNPAHALMSGRINSRKNAYPGVYRSQLASQLCYRDLRALSSPLLTGTIVVSYCPLDVNLGTPIIIDSTELGIIGVVVRVTELTDGTSTDGSVTISFVEDRFAMGEDSLVAVEVYTPPASVALNATPRLVEEAPYFELVREYGASQTDAEIARDPDSGFFHAAAGNPGSGAINAAGMSDLGAGYFEFGVIDFCSSSVTLSALRRDADQTILIIENNSSLAQVEVGMLLKLGDEYMNVVSLTAGGTWAPGDYWEPVPEPDPDTYATLVVGRACLDTIPAAHPIGGTIIFWYELTTLNTTRLADGETADVKLLTSTGRSRLALADATTETVTIESRAVRPYPPGNYEVDGAWPPEDIDEAVWSAPAIVLTWAHRDRILQTSTTFDNHTAGNIGPEVGTTYTVVVDGYDGVTFLDTLYTETGITGTTLTFSAADFDLPIPDEATLIEVFLYSVRDTYDSLWMHRFKLTLQSLLALSGDAEPGILLLSGDAQITASDGLVI